jgi:hypothetical protein
MPLSAELSANDITVAPGEEVVTHLLVRNIGPQAETVAVVATGMCGGWTHPNPATLSLFPGEQQRVEVVLHPPRSPAVSAGASSLAIRVVPHGAPDDAITAEAVVHVLAFSERRVTILQPVLRGRRSAEYDVVVENLGNTPASCRLSLSDPARRLNGRFQPPSIGVEPGRDAATTVRVRSRRRRWRGGTSSFPFEITAGQEGHTDATASATFLQSTVISAGWWKPVAALLAVGGVVAALWWGLVLPSIDRAVDDAVDQAVDEIEQSAATVPVTIPEDPLTSVPPSTSPPASGSTSDDGDAGELFAFRLPVQAPVGSTESQQFDTPSGSRLEITDIVLQNPNGDLGTARLLRNDDVLLTWRLDNIIGDDVKQYISPYELRTGDQLVFEVSCTGAGDPTLGACNTAVSLTGRLHQS